VLKLSGDNEWNNYISADLGASSNYSDAIILED